MLRDVVVYVSYVIVLLLFPFFTAFHHLIIVILISLMTSHDPAGTSCASIFRRGDCLRAAPGGCDIHLGFGYLGYLGYLGSTSAFLVLVLPALTPFSVLPSDRWHPELSGDPPRTRHEVLHISAWARI